MGMSPFWETFQEITMWGFLGLQVLFALACLYFIRLSRWLWLALLGVATFAGLNWGNLLVLWALRSGIQTPLLEFPFAFVVFNVGRLGAALLLYGGLIGAFWDLRRRLATAEAGASRLLAEQLQGGGPDATDPR